MNWADDGGEGGLGPSEAAGQRRPVRHELVSAVGRRGHGRLRGHADKRGRAAEGADKLFTPQFFLIWSYSFTVFLSAFQLLPTAPFHILALGGSQLEAGLFLGFLTYASASSAPITGAIADRLGKRRVLIIASLAITGT